MNAKLKLVHYRLVPLTWNHVRTVQMLATVRYLFPWPQICSLLCKPFPGKNIKRFHRYCKAFGTKC